MTVVFTSPLEPRLVDRIRAVDGSLEVVYEPALLARPVYACEHPLPSLDAPGSRARWEELLDAAEVLFDFGPPDLAPTLPRRPRLRWIQGTSAGVGRLVERVGLRSSDVVVTTASGVHAGPLAEFALLAMLAFAKDLPRLQRDQRERRWQRYAGEELRGKVVCVIGLGRIGREVARLAGALGAVVFGTVRQMADRRAEDLHVSRLLPTERLDELLPSADVVVLSVPSTELTDGLLDARRLALLKRTAVLVNIARGQVVDEPALVDALASGRLRGAALDVFAEEPLPAASPLWDLPNVIVSPHSASTVASENERIAELFADNLGRYLDGRPLRNVLDKELLY